MKTRSTLSKYIITEKHFEYALKIQILVMMCQRYPLMLIQYLTTGKDELLLICKAHFEKHPNSMDNIKKQLAHLMAEHQITDFEIPYLCYSITCEISLPWLPNDMQMELKLAQTNAYKREVQSDTMLPQIKKEALLILTKHCLDCF